MRFSFAAILVLLTTSPFLVADTINVPGDYPTIQGAISAASNGDTVLVKPGMYIENINFLGKAITVESSDGANVTTIDGNKKGSVVTFVNNEDPTSKLNGFTIQNGFGEGGGGIYCNGASPIIKSNIIIRNLIDGFYYGGGICCYESSAVIESNTITNNSGPYPYSRAGGIFCGYNSSLTISENVITENTSSSGAGGIYCYKSTAEIADNFIAGNKTIDNGGGGIWCEFSTVNITGNAINNNAAPGFMGLGGGIYCEDSTAVVRNNTVDNNLAKFGGGISFADSSGFIERNIIAYNSSLLEGGGLICTSEAIPVIMNNSIFGNSASSSGGAISCYQASPTIVNNTITGNSSVTSGGGICSLGNSFPNTVNNILWGNTAAEGPEISLLMYVNNGPTFTISFCDVQDGQSSVFVENGCTLNWGAGMLDADPLFVDGAAGDYHLTFLSPCRGSGDNTAVTELYDFEGDPRIAYGTVDMGADEFYTHLYIMGDKSPGGAIQGKFVGLPGTTPVGLFIGSGVLPSPMNTMWGEFWLQAPWILLGPLGTIPSDGVMVLPTTLPGSIHAPYDIPMQALIGLNPDSLTNLCVLEVR